MAVTAALSPSSFPQSSTGRFNAESGFMRRATRRGWKTEIPSTSLTAAVVHKDFA
jgi:hypothetical protein